MPRSPRDNGRRQQSPSAAARPGVLIDSGAGNRRAKVVRLARKRQPLQRETDLLARQVNPVELNVRQRRLAIGDVRRPQDDRNIPFGDLLPLGGGVASRPLICRVVIRRPRRKGRRVNARLCRGDDRQLRGDVISPQKRANRHQCVLRAAQKSRRRCAIKSFVACECRRVRPNAARFARSCGV